MKPLTDKQSDILKYMIDNSIQIMPTYREISDYYGVSVKCVYDHVKALIKKGYVSKLSGGRLIKKG